MDNKFLMICKVCADFGPYNGEMFRITPDKRGVFVEAPMWVKSTLMFKWLLNDGSITVAESSSVKKKEENDPMEGISAEGKKEEISEANEAEVAEAVESGEVKALKTRTRKTKKDDAK